MENKDNPHRQNGQRDEKIDGRAERLDDQDKQQRQEQEKGSKKSGYVAAIIINIVLLVIFNNLLNWHVPFLTGSFVIPLRILNISITATIIANLVFLAYDPAWFLALTRTVLNIIGLVFVYTLFIVFPFDFSSLTSEGLIVTLVKIVLIIGIFGTAVAVIIEFSRFVRALARI